jgi:hypothetical protein
MSKDVKGIFTAGISKKVSLSMEDVGVFPEPVGEWFEKQLSVWFQGQLQTHGNEYKINIPIYSELLVTDPKGSCSLRLRTHPNYRGEGSWFDYINIKYEFEEEEQGTFPARLACFFQLPEGIPAHLLNCIVGIQTHKEVLCLVQESKYQSTLQKSKQSCICKHWTLQAVTMNNRNQAKLTCITHTCIEEIAFAFELDLDGCIKNRRNPFIRDMGNSFDIVVIGNRKHEWSKEFLFGVFG